jgi:hypothetical protein
VRQVGTQPFEFNSTVGLSFKKLQRVRFTARNIEPRLQEGLSEGRGCWVNLAGKKVDEGREGVGA